MSRTAQTIARGIWETAFASVQAFAGADDPRAGILEHLQGRGIGDAEAGRSAESGALNEVRAAATDLAIESSVRNYPDDEWARISRADLKLVSSNDPERVRVKYMTCADFGAFSIEALKRQLEIYRALGVFEQNTTAAYEFVLSLEAGDGHASS